MVIDINYNAKYHISYDRYDVLIGTKQGIYTYMLCKNAE